MSIRYELSYIKQHYRTLFFEAQAELEKRFEALSEEFYCPQCQTLPELLSMTHAGCGYRHWQQTSKQWLESQYGLQVWQSTQRMNAARDAVSCHHCGSCCRLASSEFSYDQLLEKAAQGDDFASQFTSVFLPYADVDAAQARYPELVSGILEEVRMQQATGDIADSAVHAGPESNDHAPVHFYHCPYIGEDNLCTVYGKPKRPAICHTYPETPLTFIDPRCAWKPWKDQYHREALKTHASIELALYYSERLADCLSPP